MEKKELQTSNTDEMVTISRAEYEALKKENQSLEAETEKLKDELRESEQKLAAAYLKNDQLIEQILLSKKKLFGRSSEETMAEITEQFSFFFNEAEAWDAKSVEPAPTKVNGYVRKPRSGAISDVIPEGLE